MLYDSILHFSKTKLNWLIAFIWGLAEGLFFFIVPDVYIAFVSLFNPRGGIFAALSSVAGSLISAVIVFSLFSTLGESLSAVLLKIPGISPAMISHVSLDLSNKGLVSLIDAPLNGIPYKVYSVNAALENFSLNYYLLWSIPSRLERILPVTLVAAVLGTLFKRSLCKRTKFWLVGYTLFWLTIYTLYYLVKI